MPTISVFYGISVAMFFLDDDKHHLPHVHVKYKDDKAVISIPDGEILEGNLSRNKMKLVEAWIEIHKDELMENWELAANGNPVFKIEPLR